MSFVFRPEIREILVNTNVNIIKTQIRSEDACIAIIKGIGVAKELNAFGWKTKKRIVSLDGRMHYYMKRKNCNLFRKVRGKMV
jgi:hypothetical protein